MRLLFSNIIGDEIIRALNWTLIHSLWQGMLLAMIAGAIIFFTKTSRPAIRYNLLTAALMLFVIAVAATFFLQVIKAKQAAPVSEMLTGGSVAAIKEPASTSFYVEQQPIALKAIAFLNEHAHWIILAWLLIIGLRIIKLSTGLYAVFQLRRKQVFCPGQYWSNRLAVLSGQLQITQPVRLLQSGLAKMPGVIGYWKPVILFPAAMLASLPVNEIEAILVHELAHIRRRDFLVNMLQCILEIVFFFNPAVLWVSSLVKMERENCCDDIALKQTGDKRNYINALISFQQYHVSIPSSLANAFTGEKGQLLNRVKRIIYNKNQTLNNMEKKFLVAGMIVACAFIVAFSTKKDLEHHSLKNAAVSHAVRIDENHQALNPDTIPQKMKESRDGTKETIIQTDNGKKYRIISGKNGVKELYIDDKKIPAEKVDAYRDLTEKILAESNAVSEKEMDESEEILEKSHQDLIKEKVAMEKAQEELAHEMEQANKEMQASQKEMAEEMKTAKLQIEQEMKQFSNEQKQSKFNTKESKRQAELVMLDMQAAKKQMALNMQQGKITMELAKKNFDQANQQIQQSRKALRESQLAMLESEKLQEKIIGDFIRENIIKNKEELHSYRLTNNELIVNGIKQPAAIHKIFKEKYVKGNHWTMVFNDSDQEK
ncbi:MAG: hypothetical protein JWP81_4085 [Ferruginibacter sp.]|nr:hypothetical protein [Ferruginibacter sp.]